MISLAHTSCHRIITTLPTPEDPLPTHQPTSKSRPYQTSSFPLRHPHTQQTHTTTTTTPYCPSAPATTPPYLSNPQGSDCHNVQAAILCLIPKAEQPSSEESLSCEPFHMKVTSEIAGVAASISPRDA